MAGNVDAATKRCFAGSAPPVAVALYIVFRCLPDGNLLVSSVPRPKKERHAKPESILGHFYGKDPVCEVGGQEYPMEAELGASNLNSSVMSDTVFSFRP